MSFKVIGAGSPLVDYTANVSENFLEMFPGSVKGGTEHIDSSERNRILANLAGTLLRTPGGAAANTISVLGKLGVECAFLGKLGDDENGDFFRSSLISSGVLPDKLVTVPGGTTGYCLSLVTPDAERTMRSDLGISTAWTPEEFSPETFAGYTWLLTEGYMLEIPGFEQIFDAAIAAGCRIALDFSSVEIARSQRERLRKLLREKVDLLLCNDEEAAAFTGNDDVEENIAFLVSLVSIAVIKMGKDGSLISSSPGEVIRIPAVAELPVVDTTAAGDHYAAGFFFGLSRGESLERCGIYGAYLGGAVAGVAGSRLTEAQWEKIYEKFNISKERLKWNTR